MVRQKGVRRRGGITAGRREPADQAIVRTRGLTKRYGTFTAVDHLDLEVQPGEVFGLLGPNGAGKTTTVLMLLGLSEPSGGEAWVVGLNPTREPLAVKRRVGYLPDNVGFYGGMTGSQNLRYTARLNGMREAESRARTDQLLGEVGLSDAADKPVETYSRGMRQRLGIADALVKEPSLLILDEPTIAIDPAGVAEMLALIRRLVNERGIAVLLSSHLLEQVQSICDRVGIFVAGKMVAQGRVGELASAGLGPLGVADGGMAGDTTALGRASGVGGLFVLEVGVEGASDAVEPVLRAVSGVRSVEPHEVEVGTWIVHADGDVRGALSTALVAAGHPPLHLRRRGDELDTIYRRLVGASADVGVPRSDAAGVAR